MKKNVTLLLAGMLLGAAAMPVATAIANDFPSSHPLTKIANELKEISASLKQIERKIK